jgi:hypothetical protein
VKLYADMIRGIGFEERTSPFDRHGASIDMLDIGYVRRAFESPPGCQRAGSFGFITAVTFGRIRIQPRKPSVLPAYRHFEHSGHPVRELQVRSLRHIHVDVNVVGIDVGEKFDGLFNSDPEKPDTDCDRHHHHRY